MDTADDVWSESVVHVERRHVDAELVLQDQRLDADADADAEYAARLETKGVAGLVVAVDEFVSDSVRAYSCASSCIRWGAGTGVSSLDI